MVCIYCLEDKDKTFFQKVEHVMPQAFGHFENNMTLIDMVCDECNQVLGNELELVLARDTAEGFDRFKHGFKPDEEYKSLG